jgi:hypothetical protein
MAAWYAVAIDAGMPSSSPLFLPYPRHSSVPAAMAAEIQRGFVWNGHNAPGWIARLSGSISLKKCDLRLYLGIKPNTEPTRFKTSPKSMLRVLSLTDPAPKGFLGFQTKTSR